MSLGTGDLGVLGNLAKALGLFDSHGNPNGGWFADPEGSLKTMLSDPDQRAALIAFVDEAMGGADRSSEAGVTWLPIVSIEDPPLSIAVTIDEGRSDALHIGLGLRVTTDAPASASSLAVPLFRVQKKGGPSVSQPLLLGSPGGRIRIGTSVTVDAAPPVPGQARLGGIGIEIDLPTAPGDPAGPVFGVALNGLQLPGAQTPRDVRVSADGAGDLDDALLDLVLSLVKAQADAVTADPKLAAFAGLLGLRGADAVPDFPITTLPTRGVIAIADWVRGILAQAGSRNDWLGHLAALIGGTRVGENVQLALGGAALAIGLRVENGPSGNPRLTPSLGLKLGNDAARVEARADLFRIDLVTGAAFALPSLGLWAAAGSAASPILHIVGPPAAHADTLRIGFALDAARRLNFVLAADGVTLGTHTYPTLDLTSPDAVMDAVGDTVGDIANQLLAGLGDTLGVVKQLIGLDAPAGVSAVTLPALMADPLAAVGGYWQQLVTVPAAARSVLGALRTALADAGQAAAIVQGDGTTDVPWTLPLIGPLQLEVAASGPVLTIGIAAATSVDTLGQRCTVLQTRVAATLARIDFAARSASLLAAVDASLTARERGVAPPRARLVLGDGMALSAQHVGLRLAWSPQAGLSANVSAPSLQLETDGLSLPVSLPAIASDGSVTLPAQAWDGVQALVGRLGALIGGTLGEVVHALGWIEAVADTSGGEPGLAELRLADLVGHTRSRTARVAAAPGDGRAGAARARPGCRPVRRCRRGARRDRRQRPPGRSLSAGHCRCAAESRRVVPARRAGAAAGRRLAGPAELAARPTRAQCRGAGRGAHRGSRGGGRRARAGRGPRRRRGAHGHRAALGRWRRPHRAADSAARGHRHPPGRARGRAAVRPARLRKPDRPCSDDHRVRRDRCGRLARRAGRTPGGPQHGRSRRNHVRRAQRGDRRLVRRARHARRLPRERQHHRRHTRAGGTAGATS